MEKALYVEKDRLEILNSELNRGWKVKSITPVSQHVAIATGGAWKESEKGTFGAYVVIVKED